MAEEKKLTRIGIDVDDEILSKVDKLAEEKRWSRSMLVKVILEDYLSKKKWYNQETKKKDWCLGY